MCTNFSRSSRSSATSTPSRRSNQAGDSEAVNLSSVHQAKGLEFHTVFVIWLTDGMFPSTRSLETRDAIEEERRLFYVAITRARDELYLTYPHMRLNAGYGDMFQRPSRFLKEIPPHLVEDWKVRAAKMTKSEWRIPREVRNPNPEQQAADSSSMLRH